MARDLRELPPSATMVHVGGPTVWFVTPGEVIELRMVDDDPKTALAAAGVLGASYFIKREPHYADDTWLWSIYKTGDWIAWATLPPVKIFKHESIDPAVMWCLAMSAGK